LDGRDISAEIGVESAMDQFPFFNPFGREDALVFTMKQEFKTSLCNKKATRATGWLFVK